MATEAPDELPTQWLSITGQPLDLAPENICEGKLHYLPMQTAMLSRKQGQCVPISAFEKLNQLGEGSEYIKVYQQISDFLTGLSLWCGLPRSTPRKLSTGRPETSPHLGRRASEWNAHHGAS